MKTEKLQETFSRGSRDIRILGSLGAEVPGIFLLIEF